MKRAGYIISLLALSAALSSCSLSDRMLRHATPASDTPEEQAGSTSGKIFGNPFSTRPASGTPEQKAAPSPEEALRTSDRSAFEPTPEQQAAARELLKQQEEPAHTDIQQATLQEAARNAGNITPTVPPPGINGDEYFEPAGADLPGGNTSIPDTTTAVVTPASPIAPPAGKPGLDLRSFRAPLPTEEEISTQDGSLPKPNAVERRGLRSPNMPTTLPMDIHGKLSPHQSQ